MKFLLLCLAACVQAPSIEHKVTCSATFYCDDVPYQVSPSTACIDPREAKEDYQMQLDELTAPAECMKKVFDINCTIGDYCVPYE